MRCSGVQTFVRGGKVVCEFNLDVRGRDGEGEDANHSYANIEGLDEVPEVGSDYVVTITRVVGT